jgi:LytS/YehU family sensor histidine kinase
MATIHNLENKNQLFDLETKYRTAEKEAEIQRKELDLIKSKNKTLTITAVAILIFSTGTFGLWTMRNRQKKRESIYTKKVFELQHNLQATELSNLNNQLNPHEVKNMISSIAPELLSKAPETYKKMIRLLNVTRASLTQELTESLAVQIQQVEDFMLLQQSISPISWTYTTHVKSKKLEVQLPRLLLKNMAENSIKHGIKKNKEKGEIQLYIDTIDDCTKIVLNDNGPEWEPDHLGNERKGIGVSTYQQLFKLLNSHNKQPASLSISRNNGLTTVEILVPLDYKYQ